MSGQTILAGGLALFFGVMGLAFLFAQDWLWDRYEMTMRARGITNVERTPEWERQQSWVGGGMLVVAVVIVIYLLT